MLRLLAASAIDASVPAGQHCCAAAALHAGDSAQAGALARLNREALGGSERVLCLSSACQEALNRAPTGSPSVDDAVVFLASRSEHLRFRPADGLHVALHVPCTQAALTGSSPALRKLLSRVPGLRITELPDAGCCGAAGLHMVEFPQRAAALRAPLLRLLAESGARELLSSKFGCRLHLRNASALPVRHPFEFLAEYLA